MTRHLPKDLPITIYQKKIARKLAYLGGSLSFLFGTMTTLIIMLLTDSLKLSPIAKFYMDYGIAIPFTVCFWAALGLLALYAFVGFRGKLL